MSVALALKSVPESVMTDDFANRAPMIRDTPDQDAASRQCGSEATFARLVSQYLKQIRSIDLVADAFAVSPFVLLRWASGQEAPGELMRSDVLRELDDLTKTLSHRPA